MDSNLEIELLREIKKKEPVPIAIGDALKLLTPPMFKLWMYLHLMTDKQLESGKSSLSRILGYELTRFNLTAHSLRRAGFLFLDSGSKLVNVRLAKVCKVSGKNKIIKF